MKKLEEYVKSIPDFPEKGIIFRDVTSVLQDADGLHLAIDTMQEKIKDLDYDVVVGPESRGFIFGTPIAYNNHKPFVLIRKKGKLPRETVSTTYDLEYGSATIEMHKDSIKPGQKVLIRPFLQLALQHVQRPGVRRMDRDFTGLLKPGQGFLDRDHHASMEALLHLKELVFGPYLSPDRTFQHVAYDSLFLFRFAAVGLYVYVCLHVLPSLAVSWCTFGTDSPSPG